MFVSELQHAIVTPDEMIEKQRYSKKHSLQLVAMTLQGT